MSNAIARKLDSIHRKSAMRSVDVANVVGARPETVSRWNQGKAFSATGCTEAAVGAGVHCRPALGFYEPQHARLERDISIGEAGDVSIGDLQKKSQNLPWTCMGLADVKWFLSPSVPAVTARRVDRLEFLEVEVGDRLELVGQSRSFEVVRQVVEPGAVFVLQSDQRRNRGRPTSGPWRETRGRRGARSAGLLAQLGTASRLPLGRG